jgi:hypothetical protein
MNKPGCQGFELRGEGRETGGAPGVLSILPRLSASQLAKRVSRPLDANPGVGDRMTLATSFFLVSDDFY